MSSQLLVDTVEMLLAGESPVEDFSADGIAERYEIKNEGGGSGGTIYT